MVKYLFTFVVIINVSAGSQITMISKDSGLKSVSSLSSLVSYDDNQSMSSLFMVSDFSDRSVVSDDSKSISSMFCSFNASDASLDSYAENFFKNPKHSTHFLQKSVDEQRNIKEEKPKKSLFRKILSFSKLVTLFR